MGAEAELLILPEIAMADLKQSMARLDRAMKDSARKAGDEFEEELEKGMAAGIRRGARKAGKALKAGFGAVGGAAGGAAGGLVGMIVAAATAGGVANVQRAAEGKALIDENMEASNAKELMATADMLGLDSATTAKLWKQARRAGIEDVDDFRQFLSDINLKVSEAEVGDDPLMNQFKGMRGADLFANALASLANASDAEQVRWLDKLGGGEQLAEWSAFLRETKALYGGAQVDANWIKLTEAEAQAGLDLMSEERKVKDFQTQMLQLDEQRRRSEMAAIDQSALGAYMADERRLSRERLTRLETIEQNIQAANTYQAATEAVMTTLAEHSAETVDLLKDIKASIKERGVARTLMDVADGDFDYKRRGG